MRKLHWVAVGLLVTASAASMFAGCGTDNGAEDNTGNADAGDDGASQDGTHPTDGSGNGDGSFIDAITSDASLDAAQCKLVGQGCASGLECCSANCALTGDAGAGSCAPPNSTCKLPGLACSAGTECCTGSCVNNTCASTQCVPDKPTAGACTKGEQCCSGICNPDGTGGGICGSVNVGATCRTSGNPCAGNADCCSNFCNAGVCSSAVSFCVQGGEICSTSFDCCSGNCTKAAGATTGTCGAPLGGGASGCSPTGTVCQAGSDAGTSCEVSCCSRSCGPFGGANGFKVCQPPSGCRPTGEICRVDSDCCGSAGSPAPTGGSPNTCSKPAGAEFGRCENGTSCREPGSICKAGGSASCSAENNCCETLNQPSGNCNNTPENCCKQDALGIPRCLVSYIDCAKAIPPAGTSCATSADCCGNPCIDYKCLGAACVPTSGACTSNADCCPGTPCVAPPGSVKGVCGGALQPDGGIVPPPDGGGSDAGPNDAGGGGPGCALYGQTCTVTGDCCDGVPCLGGHCHFP